MCTQLYSLVGVPHFKGEKGNQCLEKDRSVNSHCTLCIYASTNPQPTVERAERPGSGKEWATGK